MHQPAGPTAIRTLTLIALLTALAPAAVAWSQPAPPVSPGGATEDLTRLTADALIERLTRAVDSVVALRQRASDLAAREADVATAADARAAARAAFELPAAADPVAERDPDKARERLAAWTARVAGLDQLRTLVTEHTAALQKHREAVLQLAAETRVLGETLAQLVPLRAEAERRVTAGELAADKLPAWFKSNDPAELAQKSRQRVDELKAMASRDDAVLADATNRGQELATLREAAQAAQQVAAGFVQEAVRRTDLRKELGASDVASLAALLNTRLDNLRAAAEKVAGQLASIRDAAAGLQTMQKDLDARTAPDPSSIEVEPDEVESLREARRALALAEATVAFHQNTLDQLQAIQAAATTHAAALKAAAADAADSLTRAIAVDVIARLARERIAAGEGAGVTLPEAASPDALDQRIQAARAALADITARMLQVTSDLASVATRVEATTRSLEESKQDKIARAAAVERETAWATFVREVQSVETPKLIDTFKETVGKIETAMQQLRELADASNLAGGVVDAAAKALAADPDPVVLNVLNETAKRDEFNAWLRGNQLSDAGIDVVTPAEGSVTSTNGSGAGLTDGTPAGVVDSGPTAQTGMRINMMLELRDQTVARRLGYFRDRHKQFDALAGAIRDRIARLGEEHKAALAAVELARRAWAGATTLEIRAARGDSATLPAQVKAWTQRDQVNALQARADAIRQQIDRSTGRLDAIAAGNSTDGFIEPLDARFKNLSSIIEKLRERQDLERNFETPDPATLSELDAKKLAHEVDQRMSADTGTWEKLVGFFGGAAVQDLDGLLAEYYQRVLDLERKTDNLTQRSNFTTAIEQLTEASRPIQEAVAKRVAERLAAAEAALTRELLKVKLILQPGNKDTQEKAAALGIDPAQLQKLPDSDDAGLKAAKDKLVASLLRPWARVAGYRRWQEQIAAALAQLGAIDAEIGRLKDVIASINAAAADHLRRIERLVGHTPAQLAALPVADRPAAVEMDRYRLGEIGMLRRERVQKLNWAAGGNALWLLLIPFIAWIAIRAASLVGNRLVARVTVEPADGAPPTDRTSRREREERAQTLFHVFRAAWTIIVFVLAAIYMLKAISVDVTPLIASAGIFGLAIAFGAQPLVRDFFAGFFILLENQYNLHDVVTINGITGTIERITLRLTIIRDIEGKVHYIPNGQIELVTNQTKSWARARLEIGTAYSNHPDEVIACLQEVCAGLKADHAHGRELLEFEVPGIESFGDNSINYRVHIKVIAGAQWKIAREFRRRVKLEFDKRGIEIPFPQRVIHQAAPPSALPGPSSMT